MNVTEMLKNVNAECHPVTSIDTIITRWLDRGQKVIGSKHKFSWLRQYRYTLATVASTEFYSLSPLVDTSKLILFYDSTNEQSFGGMVEQEFRMYEPNPQNGSSYIYRLVGFSPVQNQPPSASKIDFVSTSASDTTQNVTIQGLDGSGVYVTEEVTLTGMVSAQSTLSYTKVMGMPKSAATAGTVTASVTIGADTTTLVAIAPSERAVSHPVIGLFNIPDAVNTIYYDFYMKLPNLTTGNDTSIIPEQYHDAIELYAKWQCFKHLNNPTMAQLAAAEFTSRCQDMIADDAQPIGIFSVGSSQTNQIQLAQLPSMYPRDDS